MLGTMKVPVEKYLILQELGQAAATACLCINPGGIGESLSDLLTPSGQTSRQHVRVLQSFRKQPESADDYRCVEQDIHHRDNWVHGQDLEAILKMAVRSDTSSKCLRDHRLYRGSPMA